MKMLKEIYDFLIGLPYAPPERGGILGGNDDSAKFCIPDDRFITETEYKYKPDIDFLNKIINEWIKSDIDFLGIYHTHPENCEKLSFADVKYINQIMQGVKDYTNKLYFPLIIPNEKILCFYALIVADEIIIYPDAIQLI